MAGSILILYLLSVLIMFIAKGREQQYAVYVLIHI